MEKELKLAIQEALKSEYNLKRELSTIQLERPADSAHGDWASNVALTLAKELGQNPRQIAETLKTILTDDESLQKDITEIEVAGPGFINFKLTESFYQELLPTIGESFGSHDIGVGKQVMVEFGQPNTHKAFHVGHLKSAISGLSMVNLLANLGYKVIQANFYGDVGMHVAKCTWGAMQANYKDLGLSEMDSLQRMKLIDSFYVAGAKAFKDSAEAEEEIRSINRAVYNGLETEEVQAYESLRDWSLENLTEIFSELGVNYDRQYPESELSDEAKQIVLDHTPGIFEHSEGAIIFPGEKLGLNNWVFITSEDLPTYEAKDLALAYKKFSEYDLDLSIITTSVEQTARFKSIIRALEEIDEKFKDKYKHIPFGWLLRGGKKQSSRMGGTVKGMDVINEAKQHAADLISSEKDYGEEERALIVDAVAQAGLKFLILSHEFHKDINYDPDNFITLEGFSGPYVMYAYARIQAMLQGANDTDINVGHSSARLTTELELNLIRKIAQFPEITKVAGEKIAPHLIANYVFELANQFNQFYAEVPILKEKDEECRQARLLLVQKVGVVLKHGLSLLGISVVERM